MREQKERSNFTFRTFNHSVYREQLAIEFSRLDQKPLLVALYETWLSDIDPMNKYELESYDNFIVGSRSKGGGMLLFHSRRLKKIRN